MTEYSLYSRISGETRTIPAAEAEAIFKPAAYHFGLYQGMGQHIDQVLYSYENDEEHDPFEDQQVVAVRYHGEWLNIPEDQVAFISLELTENPYEA